MAEQLNRTNTDESYTSRTLKGDMTHIGEVFGKKVEKQAKVIRRAAVGVLALTLAGGAVAGIEGGLRETPVGKITEQIPAGGSPIGAVEQGVNDLAEMNGFNPNDVHGVTGAGQEVKGELIAVHPGKAVQPFESIEVTVSKNGFGQLSVSADPTNLSHFSK